MKQFEHYQIGEIVQLNGRWVRYVGSGLFEPIKAEPEVLAKRFDPADSGPLVGGGKCA